MLLLLVIQKTCFEQCPSFESLSNCLLDSAIKEHLDNCSKVEHLFFIHDLILYDATHIILG